MRVWNLREKKMCLHLLKLFCQSLFYICFFFKSQQKIKFSNFELPNQELSVLYGGPTLIYGEQLSLYVSYMLRVIMTGDLAHLQLSDLQGETRPLCRTSDLQEDRMHICRTKVMAIFPIEIILRK